MRRELAVNVALAAGVSLALLAVLEGGARLLEKRQPARPEVADYIWDWDAKMPGGFYVMKSDAVGWPPWEEFNADGLRDRTRSHEKPDGVRRLAVLGDSVTLGASIRPEQAFPQLLEARFHEEGRPIEVMNVALWGWSTRQERIAWQRIARRYRPDAAVVAVCLNDIAELHNNLDRPPRWLGALFGRSALVRRIVDAEGREIDSVERLFSDEDAPRVREALARFFEELRAMRREVGADGASFGIVVFPFRFQVQPGAPAPVVQRRIAEFCRSEQLPCLDLLPVLAPLGGAAFVDYDHLSPAGASAAAEALKLSALVPPSERAPELLRDVLGEAGPRTRLALPQVQALAAALSGREAPTRWAAAWALERAGAEAAPATAALVNALRTDPSNRVRSEAAAAIGTIGGRAAVGELHGALADPSEAVRHAAAAALARLQPTTQDLTRLETALQSGDDYVSGFAAWALGNLGEQARPAVPALARALDRPATDAVVSAALARIGPAAAEAVPILIDALRNPSADRRWRAARTLGRIGPASAPAVEALGARLVDENSAVRQHSARALGRIGIAARPAAPALQKATGDGDPAVRREARAALQRLQ